MNQSKRIDIASARLLIRQPFFASLLLRLIVVQTEELPTFATDGKHLFFNEKFSAILTDAELEGVLCHEVMHCAYLHQHRRGSRDPKGWNIACDYVINKQCIEAHLTLPECALLDNKYDGMSEEQVYADLAKSGGGGQGSNGKSGAGGKGKSNAPGQSNPGFGEVIDAPGSEAERHADAANWEVATIQAANAAKQQGKLPGFAERLIGEIRRPTPDWREQLRNFLTAKAKNDYNWRKPNLRYSGTGFFLPGLLSYQLGTVIVAIDTSGSIGGPELETFLSNVRDILDSCRPEKLIFVQCDAKVHEWTELEPGDTFEPKLKGGGGTSHVPLWNRIASEGVTPECVVALTDGCTTWGNEQGFPVFWALTTDQKPPFGTAVRIEVE